MSAVADFIVIGAGSAGCAVAASLLEHQAGTVTLVEAGPSDNSPLVKMPFGLVWLMGSAKRDWRFQSTPQAELNNRSIAIPRGRMLGGSSSINSMVWFRGCRDDFDGWGLDGWAWHDVEAAFRAIETKVNPTQMQGAHPLTQALHGLFPTNSTAAPSPEYESAGVFSYNMHKGRRRSAADAFLRPAPDGLSIVTGQTVDRVEFVNDAARRVILSDGTALTAIKGVILSAGSIGSPAILMRSGIGPRADLTTLGIDTLHDAPEIGQNLHDHPAVGLHFVGNNTGYGITLNQLPAWAMAPFQYLTNRTGRLASPTVEGGGFFNARAETKAPDVQMHFIPFKLGWQGKRFTRGSGYFADVCLCRPKSRGHLRLSHKDANAAPHIDLGLLKDPSDLDTMLHGLKRLRTLMDTANFGPLKGTEAFPGPTVTTDADLKTHIRARAATAYHPVGTLRMGTGTAPVTPRLNVKGLRNLWVADASVMPNITSANTNAPSMMIGYRAGQMITKDIA